MVELDARKHALADLTAAKHASQLLFRKDQFYCIYCTLDRLLMSVTLVYRLANP